MSNLVPIDHSAFRVHQTALILLLIAAFLANQPLLVGLACIVMLVGAGFIRRPGFGFIYSSFLRPLGWVKPDIVPDNREPHLFAQAVGGFFLLGASLSFIIGLSTLGWVLSWIVTALAALNLFAGFCVGCAVYYWLNHLHIPGFIRSAPHGTFPGMRPHRNQSSSS